MVCDIDFSSCTIFVFGNSFAYLEACVRNHPSNRLLYVCNNIGQLMRYLYILHMHTQLLSQDIETTGVLITQISVTKGDTY